MATLYTNRSGYTLPSMPVNKEGSIMDSEETTVKALAPGERMISEYPRVTVHPVDGVTFEGKPIRDWIMLFQQIEASVIGKTKWATPPEKKPDTAYMDMTGNALRPYRAVKAGEPSAPARADQVADAPAGYRPYQAPKPGKAGVTVAQAGKVRDGDGVDAELAAAGWRPYRDPRKETA